MSNLQITLQPDGVAAPVQRAALVTSEIIAASITAFADRELAKSSIPNQFFSVQFNGPGMSSDERRSMYENWLLAKGFQDLLRGVRESLEEAFLYVSMLKLHSQRTTMEAVQQIIAGFRKRGQVSLFQRYYCG